MAVALENNGRWQTSTTTTGPGASDFSYTSPTGTTLLLLSIGMRADENVTADPTWNSQTFTLINESNSSTSTSDMTVLTYGLISSGSATSDIEWTQTSSLYSVGMVSGWSGTITTSVAAATNPIDVENNNANSGTTALTGTSENTPTAGATMYAAGTHFGGDGDPVTRDDTNYTTIYNSGTGTNVTDDCSYFVFYNLASGSAPVTFTWATSGGGGDDNSGHLIEILPAAAEDQPLVLYTSPGLSVTNP